MAHSRKGGAFWITPKREELLAYLKNLKRSNRMVAPFFVVIQWIAAEDRSFLPRLEQARL